MIISKKKVDLKRKYNKNKKIMDSFLINEFLKKEINNQINTIDYILSREIDSISSREYIRLISQIYDISLEKNDYLNIISIKQNKIYDRFMDIDTSMAYSIMNKSGLKQECTENFFQVGYKVAVAKDELIENDKVMSKEEIQELIDLNKLVIVKTYHYLRENLSYCIDFYEEMPSINLSTNIRYNYDEEFLEILAYLIKENIPMDKLYKDLKEYYNNLLKEIKSIFTDLEKTHQYQNFEEEKTKLTRIKYQFSNK